MEYLLGTYCTTILQQNALHGYNPIIPLNKISVATTGHPALTAGHRSWPSGRMCHYRCPPYKCWIYIAAYTHSHNQIKEVTIYFAANYHPYGSLLSYSSPIHLGWVKHLEIKCLAQVNATHWWGSNHNGTYLWGSNHNLQIIKSSL